MTVMSSTPPAKAARESLLAAPTSALAATWRSLRLGALRQVLLVGGISLGIAVLLTALTGRGLLNNVLYSCLIGLLCTLIVGLVRLGVAWIDDRLRARQSAPVTEAQAVGWRGALAGALLAMLIGPSMGMWLGDQVTGLRSPSLLDWGSASARFTVVVSVLATVVCVVVIVAFERLAEVRTQAEAARRLAADNQLRLLQSQLEPHMLFNTLANLRVLVGLDPQRAQDMLDHLIAFLRSTLTASRSSNHPLATEFERLADYLALMAIRMGPRLRCQLDLPSDLRDLPVPPLLLQPLVENAIKHGLEPHVQGGEIVVAARREGRQLVLTVRDTGVGLASMPPAIPPALPGTGFGLAQVRERLSTLHGSAATLSLEPDPGGLGGTLVTLRLPLPLPPPVLRSAIEESAP